MLCLQSLGHTYHFLYGLQSTPSESELGLVLCAVPSRVDVLVWRCPCLGVRFRRSESGDDDGDSVTRLVRRRAVSLAVIAFTFVPTRRLPVRHRPLRSPFSVSSSIWNFLGVRPPDFNY